MRQTESDPELAAFIADAVKLADGLRTYAERIPRVVEHYQTRAEGALGQTDQARWDADQLRRQLAEALGKLAKAEAARDAATDRADTASAALSELRRTRAERRDDIERPQIELALSKRKPKPY